MPICVNLWRCAPFTPTTSCCRCPRDTSSRWRSTRGCASGSSPKASSPRMICTKRRLASLDDLRLVHDPEYVDAVVNGTVPPDIQRRIGFPWSPQMVERSRRSVGATIAAARAALDDGVAANLAGGTHHAFADRGEGFCVFNDVAVGAACCSDDRLARRPHRDRRSRRAPGQRHGRDLQRRSIGVHVLDARRQEFPVQEGSQRSRRRARRRHRRRRVPVAAAARICRTS